MLFCSLVVLCSIFSLFFYDTYSFWTHPCWCKTKRLCSACSLICKHTCDPDELFLLSCSRSVKQFLRLWHIYLFILFWILLYGGFVSRYELNHFCFLHHRTLFWQLFFSSVHFFVCYSSYLSSWERGQRQFVCVCVCVFCSLRMWDKQHTKEHTHTHFNTFIDVDRAAA